MSSSCCTNCSASLGGYGYVPGSSWWYTYTCNQCQKSPLCSTCCDFALPPPQPTGDTAETDGSAESADAGSAVCKECFKESSSLDFSTTFDVAGPADDGNGNGNDNAPGCVLFLHAASLCRLAWSSQMAALNEQFLCYSIDLPMHGARIGGDNENSNDDPAALLPPLSTESAVEVVKTFIDGHCQGKKVVLVGYSLGSFVAAAFVDKYPDMIVGAALGGAGMDLSSSFKGRMIGRLMRLMGSSMSASTKAKFASQQREGPEVDSTDFDKCVLQPGLFFWSNANETVDILLSVQIREILKRTPRHLAKNVWLFVGSKDALDFVEGWTEMTDGGKAIVYDGVGHELPFTSNVEVRKKFHADLIELAGRCFQD